MGNEQEYTTMQVTPDTLKAMRVHAEKKGRRLRDFASEWILMHIEKDEMMAVLMPQFRMVALTETALVVDDRKQSRTAEITMHDSQLYCHLCEKNDCPHIHFAMLSPELGMLKKRDVGPN